jgi:serine/threonine protein kinase
VETAPVLKTCPSLEELKRFLYADYAPTETKQLQTHLDTCRQCQETLDELTAADWIPPTDSHNADLPKPELERLIERLRKWSSQQTEQLASDIVSESFIPTDADAPLGRLREFRILQRLAGGSQGTMYLAWDEKLQRKVALKVLNRGALADEHYRQRFEREARLTASLNDQRIVRVFQVCLEPDLPPFIVMEFVAGSSLKQRVEQSRPTINEAVRWVRDAALGLAAAHQAGLIHRDIKPSNLMLDETSGLVRLTDFGLALEQADASRMTQDGALAGTPAYMSPEQLSRPESIDYRTDIYSLGVVFYELLVGEVPFRGTLRMTLLQVAHDEPRSPRQLNDQIPVDLETIMLKAMSRDPDRRFDSASELADELERWQQKIPIRSRPVGRIERFWRWCGRRPSIAALSASLLVLTLALAVVMVFSYLRLAHFASIKQRDAEIAAQQRDAAVEVLSQLVFDLQTQLDQEEFDIDEVQKNALQIAITGLNRLKQLTDQEQFPVALTAEAFRKMGDTLSRLDRNEEARDCFVRAEFGFRELLSRPDQREQALKGIVETLWSRHDVEVDDGPPEAGTNWLQRATAAARELFESYPSDETKLIFAKALLHEAQSHFDNAESEQILPEMQAKLNEIQVLLESSLDSTAWSPIEIESELVWLKSVALSARYLSDLGDHTQARKQLTDALDRAKENRRDEETLDSLTGLELSLEHQRYTLLKEERLHEQAQVQRQSLDQRIDQLSQKFASDALQVKEFLKFLQTISDQLEEDEDVEGQLYFLNHQLQLLERRLKLVPGDELASLERAYCQFEIAEAKSLSDYSRSQIRRAYREAIASYADLSTRSSFDDQQWYYYCNLLLSAAEYEQSVRGNFKLLLEDAQRIHENLTKDYPRFSPSLLEQIKKRITELGGEKSPAMDHSSR